MPSIPTNTLTTLAAVAVTVAIGACTSSHPSGDSGTDGSTDGAVDSGSDTAPPTRYDRCGEPSECTLTLNTCCDNCERPTADDRAAVNVDELDAYRNEVACPGPPPPCPRCASLPNPSLVATCDRSGESGRCRVADLENDPEIAGCTSDDECILRVPQCCECGSPAILENLIAVNRGGVARLVSLVCDSESTCAGCAPVFPPDLSAGCHPDLGLCRVVATRSEP